MARFRVSFVMGVKLRKGGVLRLPAEVRRVLGLREGDELLVTVEGGAVKLLPAGLVDPVEAYSSEPGSVDEDRVLEEGFREARRLGSRFARRANDRSTE
jgi:AbrB family looped-hinge helix DNA binding protein